MSLCDRVRERVDSVNRNILILCFVNDLCNK